MEPHSPSCCRQSRGCTLAARSHLQKGMQQTQPSERPQDGDGDHRDQLAAETLSLSPLPLARLMLVSKKSDAHRWCLDGLQGWGPQSALGAPIAAALQTHRGEISCCRTAETSPAASGSLLPHLEPLLCWRTRREGGSCGLGCKAPQSHSCPEFPFPYCSAAVP